MLVDINDVIRALENNEVVPTFQPIVELRTGRLTGFEVLARWQHPEHGLILPSNFISLAEKNGLIGEMTQQVFRKAFSALPLLPDPLTLSVNVSPIQLQYLSLPRQIQEAAKEVDFPLHRLRIEITESALVNNIERAQTIASELKAMGCKLALDDFGTGYSSLFHLQLMPFDKLKVDRSFVSSMIEKRDSRKIVAAVVGLGQALGLTTVAEGVETQEQAEMLLLLGCDKGQGWLYGKPMLAEFIPAMIAASDQRIAANSLARTSSSANSLEASPINRLSQLQAIYDGAPIGLCFIDTNQRYVSINQRFADMNGHFVSEHIGRTVQEIIPEVYPTIEQYILRALNGESIQDVEYYRPSYWDEGKEVIILASYQPAFDEANEVIGISIIAVDVTERKRVEHAIENHGHDRHSAETATKIPWIMDTEGNNIDIGQGWVKLTGLTKEQSRKMGYMSAIHMDDLPEVIRAVRKGIMQGSDIDIPPHRVKTTSGSWKWLKSHASPRRSPSGEIVRWYGLLLDSAAPKLSKPGMKIVEDAQPKPQKRSQEKAA